MGELCESRILCTPFTDLTSLSLNAVTLQGVLEHFFKAADVMPVGFDLLVTGSVPAGSGLSSSAAMVVASTLAFLTMNKKLDHLNKGELVEMAMENEKRVGQPHPSLMFNV